MRIITGGLTVLLILTAFLWMSLPREAESGQKPFLLSQNYFPKENIGAPESSALAEIDFSEAAYGLDKEGLPLGRIEKFEVDNAWGYAVYIPQTHKNPASQASDKINDSADIAQKEIYEILDHLANEKNIDFIMAEGDLYGEVPEEKIKILSDKISLRSKLNDRLQKLKVLADKNFAAKIAAAPAIAEGEKAISLLDREISLAGAPYKIKAEGSKISLYGAENEETREECTELVRDYVYQEDRLKTLSAASSADNKAVDGGSRISLLKNEIMRKLLSRNESDLRFSENLASSFFDYREKSGFTAEPPILNENAQDISLLIKDIGLICAEIKNLNAKENNSHESAPSRAENPYNLIDSSEKMNELRENTEKKIEEVVVDKRNRETAENFARALNEQNINAGILQFGAGHEKGLIEELNDQGLSVMVLSSKEVEKND
jgi:hypothetical protein